MRFGLVLGKLAELKIKDWAVKCPTFENIVVYAYIQL